MQICRLYADKHAQIFVCVCMQILMNVCMQASISVCLSVSVKHESLCMF